MFKPDMKKLTPYTKHKYSSEDILTFYTLYKHIENVVKNMAFPESAHSKQQSGMNCFVNIYMRSFKPITIGGIPSLMNFSGIRYRLVDRLFTDSDFYVYDSLLVIDSGRLLINTTSVDREKSSINDFYLYIKA